MNDLKIVFENKWSWCWECDNATIDVGKFNTCCAAWYSSEDSNYSDFLKIRDWMIENPPPEAPSPENIDLSFELNVTPDVFDILELFGTHSYGNLYWAKKNWADKIGHTIPTYEEICAKYGLSPQYDCKTAEQWLTQFPLHTYDAKRWVVDEEIPQREFLRRCRISSKTRVQSE